MSLRHELGGLRPRATLRGRVRRVRERAVRIVTAAGGAAAAWWLARDVLGHPEPFFAPVTVLVALGLSYGQRLRRIAELVVGVALGVLVGDAFVYVFGTGVWQIAVVATLAMTLATFVGAGLLLTIQAGVQAIIVTTFVAAPDQAFSRWLDALVGGSVAIVLAMVAPEGPVTRPRRDLAAITEEMAQILRGAATAIRQSDEDSADEVLARARATESLIAELQDTSRTALEVAAISPLHSRHRGDVRNVAAAVSPLDRAIRNLRVLVRRASVAVRTDEVVPEQHLLVVERLADVVDRLAAELDAGRLGIEVREPLVDVARRSAHGVPGASLSAEIIRAQVRSMVVDLLMVTGLGYREAIALLSADGQR